MRFLLAPCNQFEHQEPDPNQQISHFAEQYVDLREGNIIMLAKLSLNGVPCGYQGADACTAASAGCCPTNDAVYSTLFTNYPLVCTQCTNPTSPSSPIGWNFNKILLDKSGRPWTLEILAGGDDDLGPWIDSMLSGGAPPVADRAATGALAAAVGAPLARPWLAAWCALTAVSALAALTALWGPARTGDGDAYLRVE